MDNEFQRVRLASGEGILAVCAGTPGVVPSYAMKFGVDEDGVEVTAG